MPPGFNGPANKSYVSGTTNRPPLRLKLLITRIILGVVILIVIILGISLLLPDNSPDGVATRFVNDVVANKAASAYSLTSPSFRSETSATSWTTFVSSLSSAYSGKPKLVSSIAKNVSKTKRPEAIFIETGTAGTYDLQVFLEYSNKWQVNYFNATLSQG